MNGRYYGSVPNCSTGIPKAAVTFSGLSLTIASKPATLLDTYTALDRYGPVVWMGACEVDTVAMVTPQSRCTWCPHMLYAVL